MLSAQTRFAIVLSALLLFVSPLALAGNFTQHLGRLSQLNVQMHTLENEIHELLEKKHHAHDQKELHDVVSSLAAKHKELSTANADYEKVRQHIRFEHPDKNDTLERQYTRHELKSLEDMENEIGIDGRLDRIKSRVLVTFPLPERPKQKMSEAQKTILGLRNPASQDGTGRPEEDADAPEEIHLKK